MASREVIEIDMEVCEKNFEAAIVTANNMIGQITISNVIAQIGNLKAPISIQGPSLTVTSVPRLENKRG